MGTVVKVKPARELIDKRSEYYRREVTRATEE
jgi:hypothetical protein